MNVGLIGFFSSLNLSAAEATAVGLREGDNAGAARGAVIGYTCCVIKGMFFTDSMKVLRDVVGHLNESVMIGAISQGEALDHKI